MTWPLKPELITPLNREILAFINRTQPSAHSDVAEALDNSAQGLRGYSSYCPNLHSYAYVALHTTATHTIFALAYGMTAIAYRLPESAATDAIATGLATPSEIGPNWIEIGFTDDGITPAQLHTWCKSALEYASRPN